MYREVHKLKIFKVFINDNKVYTSGHLVYTNCGDSMMPLLRENRDLIHIRKQEGRCKKYDVPLYKRDSGQYVLHRILKVKKNGYVICGDNRCHREYNITDKHIIGVLEGVTRDGRYMPVTDKKYLLYVHLWCDFFYIRAALIWLRQKYYAFKRRLRQKLF